MIFEGLMTSQALNVVRFDDVDAFRPSEITPQAQSIPLELRNFAAARATLSLPSCRIDLLQTFPRILDTAAETPGIIVSIPLSQTHEGAVNGLRLDHLSPMFLRGKSSCHFVEPKANQYAMIGFASPMRNRGWPNAEDGFQIVRSRPEALRRSQVVLLEIVRLASQHPDLIVLPGYLQAVEESLLAAIDSLFVEDLATLAHKPNANVRYASIVDRVDQYLAVRPAATVYSEALAAACGVSVRTLQTAIVKIRGMSIHQYLRMRRLWSVRGSLITGRPGLTIKNCAMSHGFWHMGEFAAAYRAAFGETASTTLDRARH
jgi:AraC-like DNA-binding protein